MSNAIMSGEMVIDVYKKMLELQASNHNTAVALLLGIALLLVGVTYYWNKQGAKKYIHNQIQEQLAAEKINFMREIEKKITDDISAEFQKYEHNLKKVEADVYRSIAITAQELNKFAPAILWYSKALEIWIDLNVPGKIRFITDQIKLVVEKSNPSETNKISIYDKSWVLERVSKLPIILDVEKKYISSQLNIFFIEDKD